jgi:NADH:ubiquinone oxidoreductase subunit F (NADH-binding)
VPLIIANGPDWFREVGTDGAPGTIVCTVTGRTRRHGVAEVATGTPLRDVIEGIGGGAEPGRRLVAALSGVAHPLLPAERFDVGLDYEAMEAVHGGLGAAGFIVFDDTTDLVAVAHGVSRFLAVESCGQCTPCKQDGLALAERFDRLRRNEASKLDVIAIADLADTVADNARCFLGHQHQRVIQSVLRLFPDALRAHADGALPAAEPELIAPIVDIENGRAELDERHVDKQPDWTYEPVYSGQSPADQRE